MPTPADTHCLRVTPRRRRGSVRLPRAVLRRWEGQAPRHGIRVRRQGSMRWTPPTWGGRIEEDHPATCNWQRSPPASASTIPACRHELQQQCSTSLRLPGFSNGCARSGGTAVHPACLGTSGLGRKRANTRNTAGPLTWPRRRQCPARTDPGSPERSAFNSDRG